MPFLAGFHANAAPSLLQRLLRRLFQPRPMTADAFRARLDGAHAAAG